MVHWPPMNKFTCKLHGYMVYFEFNCTNPRTNGDLNNAFLSPPVLMHGGLLGVAFCLSVWMSLYQNSLEKRNHISLIIWSIGTRFAIEVDVGYLHIIWKGQGHRSKFRVTGCKNVIFWLDKNSYLLKYLVNWHQIWHGGGCGVPP